MPPERISYIDGRRLARALLAGARSVSAQREPLNRINVFPVADGDTGSNLSATLDRVAQGVVTAPSPSADEVARTAADEALLAARGNSGAIFAQFLEGLAESLKGVRRVAPERFGRAVRAAAETAAGAMAHPREGTILSVIREWAGWVERRSAEIRDFANLVPDSIPAAREALARTPDQLPVLKEAGVVDAGAQGFVHFLEGVARSLGRFRRSESARPVPGEVVEAKISEARASVLFRYCTEVLLSADRIDRDAVRRAAAPLGDSLAVVGGALRVRLHLHVNRPEDVFEVASRFGRVEETKVEDMRAQLPGRLARPGRVAIVTDSACDLPAAVTEALSITVIPLRLILGEETYLDGVTITPREFHGMLAARRLEPRTSQPPPADFREVYRALASHGAPVLGVHLSGGLSGTLGAAQTAARSLEGDPGIAPVLAVDSRTVSVAQGLVVREAARAAAAGEGLDAVARATRRAADRARIFAAVPTLDHLIRGGRVGHLPGIVARAIGVSPILTVGPDGRAAKGGSARGFPRAVRKVVETALALTRGAAAPEFGVAHSGAADLADQVAAELLARHPGAGHFVAEVAPVLAAHAGPGVIAVGFLAAERPRRSESP
jgi:DegV family protein with EDD domain